MSELVKIKAFVQEYAEAIAEILEVDVTIVDIDGLRIAGTGLYKQYIGQNVPKGSLFREVMQKNQSIFAHDTSKLAFCSDCTTRETCSELATMALPIVKNNNTIGVIGIIAFSVEQEKRILKMRMQLEKFFAHMTNLLESKLMLIEYTEYLKRQVEDALAKEKPIYSFEKLISKNEGFQKIIDRAKTVADSASTIFIRGESGTGKEVLARAIHQASKRKNEPFIAVNCASIPENLLESELFGYKDGAFTGAMRGGKPGKFELAQRGVIFLDEIGDMPLSIQPKLLRVLQEKTVDPLGAKTTVNIDVRVIAATNKDIEQMVANGQFREDLYYRLNVIPLYLLPLRSRQEDIPLYIEKFMDKYTKLLGKNTLKLDSSLVGILTHYEWPGNLRQLENAIEYMVNICTQEYITASYLPDYLARKIAYKSEQKSLDDYVLNYEKNLILAEVGTEGTLEAKKRAAKNLGISLATLYRKIAKHKLTFSKMIN